MSENLLVMHCSPTLAGLKTGNMFTCACTNKKELHETIRRCNRKLVKKGLCIVPLQIRNNRALVYVYRPAKLFNDLKHDTACRLLEERGYHPDSPQKCLLHLMRRLQECDEFPHEVGLFLGYPPEDVCGFINHKNEGCKLIGLWKVYGDATAAEALFRKYKKCTDVYCAKYAEGRSIERLTVAC